jgi:phage shock protein E
MSIFKAKHLTFLAALLLAGAVIAQQAAQKNGVLGDTTAAAQGWKMIERGALLIDVRSEQEYAQGHIENSLLIPHTELDRIVASIGPDLQRPVVLYCRSGRRASGVEAELEKMGYTDVFNATGWEALEATRPPGD